MTLVALGVLVFHFSPLRLKWLDAFYFTVTIMSTIGFGDIHLLDQPDWLKLFGCLLMCSGPTLLMVYFSLLTDHVVSRRFEETLRKPRRPLNDHIVIVGLGNVGYHVAMQLHELGESVVVIERNRASDFVATLPDEIPVIFGDAHQSQRMQETGFERARAVLAVTDDDMVNLRVAQRTKGLNPRVKTIVRLFDSSLVNRLDTSLFGIDVALNPSQAAAATFAAATLSPDVLHGWRLGGRLLMLRRIEVCHCSEWVGQPLGDLRENLGLLALLRQSGPDAPLHTASPTDRVQEDDRLIVLEEYVPVLQGFCLREGEALPLS
jgi:Trk K+ transport system NAD-binding subunit